MPILSLPTVALGALWFAFMVWRTLENGLLDGLLAPVGLLLLVLFVGSVVRDRRDGG